ncbi:RimK family alpha-L-glutamate ligase [Azospirillum brasilense]|uniref:RimK family alpha-L-glutamate ligase n=1 Tax=Azospirillum brasilense TaxID=192 RepID=A0A0P0EUY9_AZOBR|nr:MULTISPECIES: RimK family alpha-L-glutamate ligase [Azospirillum]ALJ38252.1 alpha-L-glutamate ligase [Azospirillum brasilense]MDW7554408.1 RimK family alpha-L-glutamate ligase [Azospirillum brasilense]MDW7594625.1 RimK family alpha-L-glutamate ligase [Azospirillum brasilense]MDW7629479.1 RimK family alpha-L-glutamate ligase [Azospirillum brasilense]MDX5955716.1 RimK family alpha-L-glutamate ligase [Azospirillum brasilense]
MSGERVALILTERPDWHTPRLVRAIEARGLPCRCVSPRRCGIAVGHTATGLLIPGFEDTLPAGVFVRAVGQGSFEQVTLRLGVLHALHDLGVPVCNDARAIERCVDKSMTSFLLGRAGLPTPPALATQEAEPARHILDHAPDQVLKPLFGAQGRGLQRLGGPDALPDADAVGGVYYLQPFIPPRSEGAWWDRRVFVVGAHAVAAMTRHGRNWITNVHQGATCEAAPADDEAAALAVRAAAAVGARYAGVDLIQDRADRWLVLEVNSMPAWQGLQRVSAVDIADALAADFVERVGA